MADSETDASILGKREREGDGAPNIDGVDEDDDDDVGPMPMPVEETGIVKKKRKGEQGLSSTQ